MMVGVPLGKHVGEQLRAAIRAARHPKSGERADGSRAAAVQRLRQEQRGEGGGGGGREEKKENTENRSSELRGIRTKSARF